ncbi:MAG: response regulator [Candidatus Aminicenantes bacterium]|nr:response regulator [Candidatus Aminicenantes bacterium]
MTKKNDILIIEDEVDIGILLKEFLENNNFNITLAEEGKVAVELLKRKHFDLLIVDMLLPGEHGLDIINMKRHNSITPVIIVSGIYDENEVLHRMKDSNVKFFLKKPFDLNDLLEKVNSAIDADQI